MPLDPQIAALLGFLASSGAPAMHDVTPEAARQMFRALAVDGPRPTVVLFHGGG